MHCLVRDLWDRRRRVGHGMHSRPAWVKHGKASDVGVQQAFHHCSSDPGKLLPVRGCKRERHSACCSGKALAKLLAASAKLLAAREAASCAGRVSQGEQEQCKMKARDACPAHRLPLGRGTQAVLDSQLAAPRYPRSCGLSARTLHADWLHILSIYSGVSLRKWRLATHYRRSTCGSGVRDVYGRVLAKPTHCGAGCCGGPGKLYVTW